jgi:hypothetical protein
MQHCTKQLYQQKKKQKKNANHPLTNVNLKNTEIKSLACDVRKHEPPTHKRQSQKHRNQKLGL